MCELDARSSWHRGCPRLGKGFLVEDALCGVEGVLRDAQVHALLADRVERVDGPQPQDGDEDEVGDADAPGSQDERRDDEQ